MVSADTDGSSGARGMACAAESAARLRPIANADAARIFMEGPFLLVRDEITGPNDANIVAIELPIALPAMPAPVMTPSPVTPVPAPAAPVAAMPSPVPAVSPTDLFGLETIDIVLGSDRGFSGLSARRHEPLFR
jgi:hypothetical protein